MKLQQKRDNDSKQDEHPQPTSICMNYLHRQEQEPNSGDEKQRSSYLAVKTSVFNPVQKTSDGHCKQAR